MLNYCIQQECFLDRWLRKFRKITGFVDLKGRQFVDTLEYWYLAQLFYIKKTRCGFFWLVNIN